MENTIRKKDIAIVGISGKYAKSDTLDELWEHLKNGEELVHFYTDDELRAAGVKEEALANPDLVKAQAFLADPNSFDYSFFGYTKQEALSMDPQIRMMHEQVWLALEDSGYNPHTYKDKIGLFLSASDNLNWRAHSMISNNDNINSFFLNQISNKNFISTLISYNLNLRGPSYYVDTACSSSLVAIHQACRSLLMRECSIAISGGVRIFSKPYKGHLYQEGMTNSKDGHCKAFDEDSSGIVSGEGAGVVVLKRLEDAIADNDQIYAVIRASVVNNDGNRKVGYTAPSINGQYECIKQAHQIADVTPESITYIEAHGTGTKLGDPIEVEALNKSFGYNTDHQCALGSIKTNMGHLDAAAGITGFLKTTLSLKNKMLAPSLHFKNPNSEINFKSGPFKVQTKVEAWNSINNQPLRAGVSSFGIGGNNAHVVLQEAPEKKKQVNDTAYKLLRFSAQSVGSLNAYQEKLVSFLQKKESDSFRDMAYTLQTGRQQFKYNRFLVSNSKENALEILKDPLSTAVFSGKLAQKRKVVFMCTGSGAQYLNMGKDLYENEPYFRQLMDEGFAVIKELSGVDVAKVLYKKDNDIAVKGFDINKNEFTQPVIFVFEYALSKLMMHWGIYPDRLIGHSTGEFVAACLSEVFPFETGVRLVAKRALLMNETPKGSMLSVSLSEEKIKKYLNAHIALAVVNSPESCVLSGTEDAIDSLVEIFESEEILCSKLRISLGGHSFLMDSVLEEFRQELEKVPFSAPKIPFVSNLTGELITPEEVVSTKYWTDHLRSTVRFSDGLTTLLKEPNTIFIEVGPGNTLTTLFHQHKQNEGSNNTAVNLIRHPKQEINDQAHLLQKIGELWINGLDINWEAYYGEQKPYKVSMPGYVFNKTKLPVKVEPFEFLNFSGSDTSETRTFKIEDFDDSEAFIENLEENELSFANYVAPTNETEKILAAMWGTFFSKEEIGILDDFFAMGGNSLKGITMLKLIQKKFDIDIKIKDFYQKSTIKELAAEIDMGLKIITIQEENSYKAVMTI